MKKILLCMLSMLIVLPMMAQSTMPVTYRFGNKYSVNNELMNKRAYEGYLKNTCPTAYNKFHAGRVTANVGWGLFAGGFAGMTAGLICVGVGANKTADGMGSDLKPGDAGYNEMAAGLIVLGVSSAASTASIVCLGVGYGMMHNAATLYNVEAGHAKSQAYFSLDAVPGGAGLAYHF